MREDGSRDLGGEKGARLVREEIRSTPLRCAQDDSEGGCAAVGVTVGGTALRFGQGDVLVEARSLHCAALQSR